MDNEVAYLEENVLMKQGQKTNKDENDLNKRHKDLALSVSDSSPSIPQDNINQSQRRDSLKGKEGIEEDSSEDQDHNNESADHPKHMKGEWDNNQCKERKEYLKHVQKLERQAMAYSNNKKSWHICSVIMLTMFNCSYFLAFYFMSS